MAPLPSLDPSYPLILSTAMDRNKHGSLVIVTGRAAHTSTYKHKKPFRWQSTMPPHNTMGADCPFPCHCPSPWPREAAA